MASLNGNLRKMKAGLSEEVQYHLELGGESIHMNALLGRRIHLHYLGKINCIRCGRETKRSFAQGYCYPCFTTAPETEECVLRPELCQAHEGIARDMDFAREHCLIDHFVYLSLTSGIKVGVTRHHQVPVRWIDQGAVRAVKVAVTPNRHLAGSIEVALKERLNDKTNWRNMLTNKVETGIDLVNQKYRAIESLHPDFQALATDDDEITHLNYPVLEYPVKVKSLNFDKAPMIEDVLTGIKGQYLIFESGAVINIRKFGGYLVEFSY
jgi:hypothetical protein